MTSIDEVTGLALEIKRTTEEYVYDFDFSVLMNAGDSIVNVDSISQTKRGNVTGSADVIFGVPIHDSGNLGQVRISGGTDDEYYCLDMLVSTSSGEKPQCSGVLWVKDAC